MLTKFSNNTIFSDSLLYSFLIDTIKQHCTLYNFSSIQTPLCQRNGSLRTDAYANLIEGIEFFNTRNFTNATTSFNACKTSANSITNKNTQLYLEKKFG